ncbi:D-alanyl-D-alanine carboxypeptidase family protein [Bacillus sp. FJAT-27245]|uniref:D-alanyl-D-alanine carboxypeptidase family protein n=1 Tax=Bacillus sp. FJAT-27245 TaxID=1684144 RepID=UPI000A4F8C55|nr:D-alanyl-D-alanine carboxypeptidase family protein [Bacillus sp. FJAT-27245]
MFNSKYKSLPVFLMVIILILSACTAEHGGERSGNDRQTPPAAEDQESNSKSSEEQPAKKVAVESKPYKGELELPVEGVTGYTSIPLELKEAANPDSKTIETMKAGTAFEIISEEGEWWFIKQGPSSGWLPHQYCFINLPDVIPSIVYDNTNTYSSKFVSSGKAIPTITGRALYVGKTFNERLGKEEYIMPVLYTMSKKIHKAQQNALKEGDSLKIYEAFRPFSVQKAVVDSLSALAKKDPDVMTGINTPPWNITWFITNGVSNHQKGYAIDVSLVKVNEKKEVQIGAYTVSMITDYTEYVMPTPIHELSGAAAVFAAPVPSRSATAWKSAANSESMNEAAMKLQTYCTSAGLSPLASEWWHFNDLEAMNEIADNPGEGKFVLTESYSSNRD